MTDSNDEPTTCTPSDIKRVSRETIHKICSAQVILNLGIAIKELVENSVDAGATIIEIKMKEHGSEGFEVVDNGSGVLEEDFQGITAKHHTSKLKNFSDLEQIKTFGFRGEALSSLCAIADVTILTRHKSSEYGTLLQYDNGGSIINKTIKARNVGTTVSVTNFFKTLPVRKKEFQKNYRKEFTKMVHLLQEYCLVLVGVKVICTNQTNGSKKPVLTTSGQSIMENIISIFGTHQAQEIIKIKSPTNDGSENGIYTQESLIDISSPIDLKDIDIDKLNELKFRIEGYISDIDHKCGRTNKDRQFTYVNSRPVEYKSAIKSINDIYHIYNLKQYPFVFINFKLDQSNVDVNLSKDKRQVALVNDTIIQHVLKKSLLQTFGELPTKFKFSSVNNVMKNYRGNSNDADESEEEDEDDKIRVIEPNSCFGESLKQWKINPHNPFPKTSSKRKIGNSNSSQPEKLQKIDTFMHKLSKDDDEDEQNEDSKDFSNNLKSSNSEKFIERTESIGSVDEFVIKSDGRNTSTQEENYDDVSFRIDCKTINEPENKLKFENLKTIETKDSDKVESDAGYSDNIILSNSSPNLSLSSSSKNLNSTTSDEIFVIDTPSFNETFKRNFKISLDRIEKDLHEENEAAEKLKESRMNKSSKFKFKELIDPSKNKNAEVELETEIKKDMFKDMKVIGQFNLGFIIAKLEDDLFIVDQHATDERYNFECLKKSLKIDSQSMLNPQRLELSSVQEQTIIDNLNIFEMNGFKFEIDETALPTQRIKLISRPYSKNWEFGKEDIEEMIFMLQDAPQYQCRPSRIIKMLASRACRKSVMIGDALDFSKMKKLLTHMGEIEHPWNCPHGRPTIRFLQNLTFIDNLNDSDNDDD